MLLIFSTFQDIPFESPQEESAEHRSSPDRAFMRVSQVVMAMATVMVIMMVMMLNIMMITVVARMRMTTNTHRVVYDGLSD